jgi:hypothetical protein
MNIAFNPASLISPKAEWQDSKSYFWITKLPRRAIAWEFLRRSPCYHEAFVAQQGTAHAERSDWPMVRLRGSGVGRSSGGAGLDQNGM